MDKNKHTDWTDSVRQRLEGRELKPSDALWERIGEALPQVAGPHKVRRLPWGGILGTAAAAAVAAVLFLRPAGRLQEDSRIDVVTDAARPTAMVERAEESVPAVVEIVPDRVETPDGRSFASPRATERTGMTEIAGTPEKVVEKEEIVPEEETVAEYVPSEVAEMAEKEDVNVVDAAAGKTNVSAKQTSARPERIQAGNGSAMTIEEYIAAEEAARRRHRSLTAAVFAAGLPTPAIGAKEYAMEVPPVTDRSSLNIPSDSMIPIDGVGGAFDSVSSSSDGNNGKYEGGYIYNPESPNGFEPVKYNEDPYNINGTRMNHSKPVNVGLALTLPLNDRLFVESGVYWSYLRSTSSMVSDQSLHSVGIPLKLGWRIGGWNRMSLSVSAGAKAEKVVYAVRNGNVMNEPGIQLAAVGNAAVQYGITRHLGLFVAPELSYWFTQTDLPTYNTENPFNLTLKAGLNLKLGK